MAGTRRKLSKVKLVLLFCREEKEKKTKACTSVKSFKKKDVSTSQYGRGSSYSWTRRVRGGYSQVWRADKITESKGKKTRTVLSHWTTMSIHQEFLWWAFFGSLLMPLTTALEWDLLATHAIQKNHLRSKKAKPEGICHYFIVCQK